MLDGDFGNGDRRKLVIALGTLDRIEHDAPDVVTNHVSPTLTLRVEILHHEQALLLLVAMIAQNQGFITLRSASYAGRVVPSWLVMLQYTCS